MCGACGILGGGVDWIDSMIDDQQAPHKKLAERRRRIALVNMLLEDAGVRLNEHGRQLVVRGPTGATRLVTELAHVWRSADELGRRKVDPLDPDGSLLRPSERR
jgi:hypothetical protein